MATGWNFHELYLWHDTGHAASIFPAGLTIEPGEHAENASTKRRFRNLLDVSGLLDRLTPLPSMPIGDDDLALFHDRDYIARIKAQSADRGATPAISRPSGRAATRSPASRSAARRRCSTRWRRGGSPTATRWCARPATMPSASAASVSASSATCRSRS